MRRAEFRKQWPEPAAAEENGGAQSDASGHLPAEMASNPVAESEAVPSCDRARGNISTAPPRLASSEQIHTAIEQAYTDAERGNQKPPNKREVVKPVQAILKRGGLGATGRQIEREAGDARYEDRRLKRGEAARARKINKGIQ